MTALEPEVMERKLAYLRRYLDDLGELAGLDDAGRRAQHYAVERLLQLLCEVAVDPALDLYERFGAWVRGRLPDPG